MTTCEAARCTADAVESVLDVADTARTREDPQYVTPTKHVLLCTEHAMVMRRRAMAPYARRAVTTQAAAIAALDRLKQAAPGEASPDDLALLDRFIADAQQIARLAEDSRHLEWQVMSAQLETKTTAMDIQIQRHLR